METWRILVQLHNMPGAGYYEVALGASIASLYLQYHFKKNGKEEAANLTKGLTILGLGAICIEAIMTMLKLMGQILL